MKKEQKSSWQVTLAATSLKDPAPPRNIPRKYTEPKSSNWTKPCKSCPSQLRSAPN